MRRFQKDASGDVFQETKTTIEDTIVIETSDSSDEDSRTRDWAMEQDFEEFVDQEKENHPKKKRRTERGNLSIATYAANRKKYLASHEYPTPCRKRREEREASDFEKRVQVKNLPNNRLYEDLRQLERPFSKWSSHRRYSEEVQRLLANAETISEKGKRQQNNQRTKKGKSGHQRYL